MRINQACQRLTMDLGFPITPTTLRFYERIGLVTPERTRNKTREYRKFGDKEYALLQKAIILRKLNYSTVMVDEVLNKNNADMLHALKEDLKVRQEQLNKWCDILKEIL